MSYTFLYLSLLWLYSWNCVLFFASVKGKYNVYTVIAILLWPLLIPLWSLVPKSEKGNGNVN